MKDDFLQRIASFANLIVNEAPKEKSFCQKQNTHTHTHKSIAEWS